MNLYLENFVLFSLQGWQTIKHISFIYLFPYIIEIINKKNFLQKNKFSSIISYNCKISINNFFSYILRSLIIFYTIFIHCLSKFSLIIPIILNYNI